MMKLVVIGAGESGTGAALLGKRQGFDVFVTDSGIVKPKYARQLAEAGVKWEQQGHSEAFLQNADLVVKSPGIPSTVPAIKNYQKKGTEVISEIEFAARYTNAKIIGITGTNGKTTTTLLTWHILTKAGLKAGLAGNVGKSFAAQVASEEFDYYVLELSSFQLEEIDRFRPYIAVMLNITPDHLDRYDGDIRKYAQAKFQILKNMQPSDHLIYNAADELILSELSKVTAQPQLHGFSLEKQSNSEAWITAGEELTIQTNSPNKPLTMSIYDLALTGKHNAQNSMAAGIAARILEIRKELVRDSLADFQNVEHRLELVAQIHGISFINDSKATNVNSTWYALESMQTQVVWIVGGVDKGNDYSMLDALVAEKVKAIICLGTDNKKLLAHFTGKVEQILEAGSAAEAVGFAYQLARKGDTVLLSPACASFDLFEDYEQRGQKFKEAVRAL